MNWERNIIHIGNVVIGNYVNIGSNTAIDRASLDSTQIGNNVKIDNLVQIAHSVLIGDNTIIAAQVGIAGSASIGKNCIIGGQAGISGHINVGNNVTIAAKSGVTKNRQNNKTIAGFGAPTKATTLMNHFGIDENILDFIVDDNPLKQGLFTPISHIPVLSAEALYEKKPDYVLILAWNFAIPIMKNHKKYSDEIGQFILPMPLPQVVDKD